MFDFSGKKFLITGGNSGIGLQCARDLLKSGATVVISGSNTDKLEKVSRELSGEGTVYAIARDLRKSDEVPSLFDDAADLMGGVDAFICNAGIIHEQLTIRVKLEDWQKVLDVNLTAAFLLNHKACAYFMRQKHGKIVNISSILASSGTVGQVSYCAAKGGIEAMTRALALEFGSKGVNVNCVAPGFIETPMTDGMTEETRKMIIETTPVKRVGKPSDISGVVLFLCSEAAGFITGQVVHVNGGRFFSG